MERVELFNYTLRTIKNWGWDYIVILLLKVSRMLPYKSLSNLMQCTSK